MDVAQGCQGKAAEGGWKGDLVKVRTSGQDWTEWFALAACVVVSTGLLCWLLARCRAGFDFTDEGYYLNWISNPGMYPASVTQFGFIYHPLYKLLGDDVALLRQANMMITFGLSQGACVVLMRSLCPQWSTLAAWSRSGFLGVSWVIASSSLVLFDLWTPTPSYNSLSFQALVIVAIGILLTDDKRPKETIAGWILVGLGGALCFMAKPSTAAVLGCLIVLCIVLSSKWSIVGLLISLVAASFCLAIFALLIDGSLPGFFRRMLEGFESYRLLLPNSGFLEDLRLGHPGLTRLSVTFAFVVTYLAIVIKFVADDRARFVVAATALLLAGASAAFISGVWTPGIAREWFRPVVLLAIPLALLIGTFTSRSDRWESRGISLVLLFVALPFVYAFGTGANFWELAARAGFFWVLAGLMIGFTIPAAKAQWQVLLPVAAVSLCISSIILLRAMEDPYRQTQPLRLQATVIEINREGARLNVTDEIAVYLTDVRRLADIHGFKVADKILDLSGSSPGAIYAIGARSLGSAWNLAGYPGSNDFLIAMLARETCASIGAAWILMEPNSPNSFSPRLLQRFGIDVDRDYQDLGSVRSVRPYPPSPFQHHLLKPKRSPDAARQACEQARKG